MHTLQTKDMFIIDQGQTPTHIYPLHALIRTLHQQMLKFWATNLVKLTGSRGDSFVSTCFHDLVAVLLEGHRLMAAQR